MRDIYYSLNFQERTDAAGRIMQPTEKIVLSYGKQEWFQLHIPEYKSVDENVICWDVIVYDTEQNSLLCHTIDADIMFSDREYGQVVFSVNTKTKSFLQAVRKNNIHGWMEVRGIHDSGNTVFCMRFRILAQYTNDPSEDIPVEVIDDFATMSWVKNLLSGGENESFVTKEMLESKFSGMTIDSVEISNVLLAHNTVVQHFLSEEDVITIDTSEMTSDKSVTMELWLTMPKTVVSFSIPGVNWLEEPSFDTANMLYCVVLRWDGEKVLANVAYSVEVS